MEHKRKIIHVDMDAFFASVEQLDNPSLRSKPLVVGGSPRSRGVVAACSYAARAYGIHSAMPCRKAAQLCPHAVFTPPRMSRYREVSGEIMRIFHQYTPLVEPLSLDEAFLDVTANHHHQPSATILAERIRRQIEGELGLTASAGVSFNKFIAKVASDLNKPNGLTTITPEMAPAFIARLPIRKFYGVGSVTEKRMHALGIACGADLLRWDEEQLRQQFGKCGSFLHAIARGDDPRPVQPFRQRKSIGSETTLAEDTDDPAHIETILAELADDLAASLGGKQFAGKTLTLKIRYHDFTTITRSKTGREPIRTAADILTIALRLAETTDLYRRKVRLLGLAVANPISRCSALPRQLTLPFRRRGDS